MGWECLEILISRYERKSTVVHYTVHYLATRGGSRIGLTRGAVCRGSRGLSPWWGLRGQDPFVMIFFVCVEIHT